MVWPISTHSNSDAVIMIWQDIPPLALQATPNPALCCFLHSNKDPTATPLMQADRTQMTSADNSKTAPTTSKPPTVIM